MSTDLNKDSTIEDLWGKDSGTENGPDNRGKNGQEEGENPEDLSDQGRAKSDDGLRMGQNAKDNQGNVNQQTALGNNNTQQQSQNQQADVSKNAGRETRINQQTTDGHNNNQNSVEVVVKNIIGDNKDEKKYSFSQNQSNAKQEVIDPTKPLPPKSKSLPDVGIDDLSDYSQKLQEDYLVIVTCSDLSTALSIAYSLTEKISVSNKRLFTGELGASKNLDIEINIDNIVFNSAIGKEESTLIVVDSYEAQTFLDSLVVQPSTAGTIKQDLKNSQRFCICIAESTVLETILERKRIKSLSFPHLEVPFLESKATNENIDQQIAIYEKEHGASLYEKADVLRKTVLYVATFFQGLSLSDFERIVCLLLGEQTTLIEDKNKVETPVNSETTVSLTIGDQVITFNQPPKGVTDRSVDQPLAQTKKLLRDIWEEDPEQILQECYLELSLNEYSSRVINFSLPHLRGELKKYFEDRKFIEYRKKFRKLIELNLLFDTSSQVIKALKDLSVAMMLFQPGIETWVDWLVHIFIEALDFKTDAKSKDFKYIYYSIVGLLRETLNYPELEDILETFLNRLIEKKSHKAVLEISKRLRSAPQFDEYEWFYKCINQGSEEVRQEAYQTLYNITKQSGLRVYEILEKLKEWLPNLERDPKTYSHSNKYALQLLPQYLEETLKDFDTNLYGSQPFKFPIFGGLQSGESVDSKLKMIVEWLVHPGLDSIINNDNDSDNDNVDSILIISIKLFPGLFNILLGLNEEVNVQSEVSSIFNSLLQAIHHVTRNYKKRTNINEEDSETILNFCKILLDPDLGSIIDDDVEMLLIVFINILPVFNMLLQRLNDEINIQSEINSSLLQEINEITENYKKITNTKEEYREIILNYWRILSDFLLEVSNIEIIYNDNWKKGDELNYKRNVIDYLIERLEAFPIQ